MQGCVPISAFILTQSDIVSNLKNNYGEAMVYRDADHMGTA
jgi:hypothetical protein